MCPSLSDERSLSEFSDNDEFLRRIPPALFDFEKQEIQSWAFSNDKDSNSFSVNFRNEISSVEYIVENHTGYGVVSFTYDFLHNDEQQEVVFSKCDSNPAHCDVVGEKNKKRQRRLRNRAMANLLLLPQKS